MVKKVYALRDVVADSYGHPMLSDCDANMKRALAEIPGNPKYGNIGKYPYDYDLMQIGDYDDHSGTVIPLKHNIFISNLQELSNVKRNSVQQTDTDQGKVPADVHDQ